MTIGESLPLVSIFMFVRNGAASIQRALASVQAQTYPNIEFVVQDGASTDGTLEFLRGFGGAMNVVSEPDSGPNEGLWRALNRCNGEFIGSCLADEELLPDAVERAVGIMRHRPDVGAITGDAVVTDLVGVTTGFWKSGPFNLVDYLLCDYCPFFVASFFRRQALLDAGLKSDEWGTDCVEFELWCRLANGSRVEYIPGVFAKYASHANQSSNNERDVVVHFTGRLRHIISMCRGGGILGTDPLLRTLFIWGHARAFINHAFAFDRPRTAEALYKITKDTLAGLGPIDLDGIRYDENYSFRVSARNARNRLLPRVPASLRDVLRQGTLERLVEKFEQALLRVRFDEATPGSSPLKALLRARPSDQIVLPPPPDMRMKAKMYAQLSSRYEADNRLSAALVMYKAIARLADLPGPDCNAAPQQIGYTSLADANRSSSSSAQSR